jgi:diketogulonate reductase-like aldo/keto reductase
VSEDALVDNIDARSPVTLHRGVSIPRLGLGVFRTGAGRATRDAVLAALDAGYRHIDTAHIYGNEAEVGEAVRQSGVARSEIFVTTKLWNDDHGYDPARRAFDRSLRALGLDTIDLYLVHFPVRGNRPATWRAMESILSEGRARAIGVSNYMEHHLDELLGSATIPPAVNQIELHPFLQQRGVVARCRQAHIAIEAYSPLTKGRRLGDPRLAAVARKVARTPAQVLIRWSLQKDFIVLPKSASKARIVENAQALDFELDDETMRTLDALEDGTRTAWDPTSVP